jgi:hypothetical protein
LCRICHLLRDASRSHLWGHRLASKIWQSRPVDSVGQHELLAADLASALQKVALLHDAVGSLVEWDHRYRDSVVGLGRSVMHDEQTDIWLRRVGVARDRH